MSKKILSVSLSFNIRPHLSFSKEALYIAGAFIIDGPAGAVSAAADTLTRKAY
jgi:hypothetical protein